ncbi:uncharacterized protein LOC144714736 [Wolffia australiana]
MEDDERSEELGDLRLGRIGSRIFPLRGTPTAMPSVGTTRRSTRVFVRKKAAPPATRVLRSGKRLSLSKSTVDRRENGGEEGSPGRWMQDFGGEWWKTPLKVAIKEETRDSPAIAERFGVCYGRKRRRSLPRRTIGLKSSWSLLFDGLKSVSQDRRKKRRLFLADDPCGTTVCGFAEKILVPESCIWVGSSSPAAILLLVQSSRSSSLGCFSSLLVSILTGMMSEKTSLSEFASMLSSRPAFYLLPLNDIHSLPLKTWKRDFYRGIASLGSGSCLLFRPRRLLPRISVNFAALPFLFKTWHFNLVHRQIFLPGSGSETSAEERRLFEYQSGVETSSSVVATEQVVRQIPRASVALKFRTRGRKRSLLRNGRVPSGPFARSRRSKFSKADAGVKIYPIEDAPLPEREAGVNQKRRRFAGRSSMKAAATEVGAEGLTCSANVLVIEADRCWREAGAKVGLELASSEEWRLVVRLGDSARFSHKAQEMKPSSWNRFTHAVIWAGESEWKLEFCSKDEWGLFKELHKECMERNLQGVQARVVPVPGVREISGYEESCSSGFERPECYIRAGKDEVGRVMDSQSAVYDMDSGDEEWVQGAGSISRDEFEGVVSALEKVAYEHPDDVSDQSKAAALCGLLGGRSEFFGQVFEYWAKKRRQKHSALVRVFQVQPSRKKQQQQQQQGQKPHLRKKRSLKRQVSHAGRGNVDIFFEAVAEQEVVERFQTASASIKGYVDAAIKARSRAQELMVNADLAAYKAAVAVQLAEAIREGSTYPSIPSSP